MSIHNVDRPRIAFVLCQYPLGFSAMIINSIVLFARRGHEVDVYIDGPTIRVSPIELNEPGVRIVVCESGANLLWRAWAISIAVLAGRVRLFASIARKWPLLLAVVTIFPRLFLLARWLKRELTHGRYSCVIAVEAPALITLCAIPAGQRIVYYDMELLDWNGNDPTYVCKLPLKNLQSRMLKRVERVVIQSPHRAEVFARINEFAPAAIDVLPVAAMGAPIPGRGRFFRDKFAIGDDVTLVVYSGNFARWAKCAEIIKSVREWPDKCALVMHTWRAGSMRGGYFREMKRAAAGLPVFFSAEYLAYDELAGALSSCDIGILLYEAINENFTEILFSSNKLAEYLKAGLPVVCSDFPSLREFVERWDVGVAISSPSDLPAAIRTIERKGETMKENARRCYEAELRFERHFETFYETLDLRTATDE